MHMHTSAGQFDHLPSIGLQIGLQVGVANDVIPLFGGQTREFAGV